MARNLSNSQSIQPTDNGKVWKDWRNFVVVRKVKESEEITSFYLKPEDKGEVPNFQPGQFLTIKLDIPGQSKPIIRTYSLSDYPQPHDYYWDGNFSNVQKIFDESGKLLEEAYIRRLDKFLKELIWMAKVLRYGRENVALE